MEELGIENPSGGKKNKKPSSPSGLFLELNTILNALHLGSREVGANNSSNQGSSYFIYCKYKYIWVLCILTSFIGSSLLSKN